MHNHAIESFIKQIPGARKGAFMRTLYKSFKDKVGWIEYDVFGSRDRPNPVPDFYTIDVDKMEVCVYEVNDTHRPSPHKYDLLFWLLDEARIDLRYIQVEAETGYAYEIYPHETALAATYASVHASKAG